MSVQQFSYLQKIQKTGCPCGKEHRTALQKLRIGAGAISQLPALICSFGAKKPFLLADENTFRAAGETVCALLKKENIPFSRFLFGAAPLEPDENAVGAAVMHYDTGCDLIIGIGSGVINDIGKLLSSLTATPYFIVATAPSVDGFASATSSMNRGGLKISLPSRCPDAIIGDTDVLRRAPLRMLQAGLGDMLAKYVSLCEWRISHLVNGEYYCEHIAALIRDTLRRCVKQAEGLVRREPNAVEAVFEGLVLSGLAMNFAGISRPASGVEHYFSHVWDMRGLQFGLKTDLHGIQCAVGTLLAVRMYEQLQTLTPDRVKALRSVRSFDYADWCGQLRAFLGHAAEPMILLEKKEQKYSVDAHAARLEILLKKWPALLAVMHEELPASAELERLLHTVGAPCTPGEIGIDERLLPMTFRCTKDIRDKYVLSRLAWDLGLLDTLSPFGAD